MNKKRIKLIFISLIIFAGMAVFLYPVVSNYINALHQTRVISNYEESIAALSADEKRKKLEMAQAYNEALTKKNAAVADPFDNDEGADESLSFLNIGASMGAVRIPKISLETPIYQGTAEEVLQKGVGWMEGTSLPIGGNSTHCVLTGHRGLPTARIFTDLDQLQEGDEFFIISLDEILAYQIDQIRIMLPEGIVLPSIVENEDYVTLLTCHPYMVNSHRLLVTGKRIPYTGQLDDIEENSVMDLISIPFRNPYRKYVIGFTIVLAVLLFWTIITKRRKKT